MLKEVISLLELIMTKELRPYQIEAVNATIEKLSAGERPIAGLATGGGKSLIASAIFKDFIQNAEMTKGCVIFAHRDELVRSNILECKNYIGEGVGYFKFSKSKEFDDNIVPLNTKKGLKVFETFRNLNLPFVISVSIQSWKGFMETEIFKHVNLVCFDECHWALSGSQEKVLELSEGKFVFGMSATPHNFKGEPIYGKGKSYDSLSYDCILGANYLKLVNDGYLNKHEYLQGMPELFSEGELKGLKIIRDDYNIQAISNLLGSKDVASRIKHYVDNTQNKELGLIFVPISEYVYKFTTVIKSLLPNENIAGVTGEVFYEQLENERVELKRHELINNANAGKYKYIANCEILTTGVNIPRIDSLAYFRPTASKILWRQTLGRGGRLSPETNKTKCEVYDYVGNTEMHGAINGEIVKSNKIKADREVYIVNRELGGKKGEIRVSQGFGCPPSIHLHGYVNIWKMKRVEDGIKGKGYEFYGKGGKKLITIWENQCKYYPQYRKYFGILNYLRTYIDSDKPRVHEFHDRGEVYTPVCLKFGKNSANYNYVHSIVFTYTNDQEEDMYDFTNCIHLDDNSNLTTYILLKKEKPNVGKGWIKNIYDLNEYFIERERKAA